MRNLSCALVFFLLSSLAFGQTKRITGVTQSWTYNRVDGSGTLTVINRSQKAITGYCAAVAEDSKESGSFRCSDFLPLIITIAQSGDPALREKYGDGTFLPGASRDMVIQHAVTDEYTTVKAEVVAIAYADGTTESTNPRALASLMNGRRQEITVLQTVNAVIKKALADPAVSNHRAAILAELQRLDAISKDKNDGLRLEWNIKNLPKDDAALAELVQKNDERIRLTQKAVTEVQP
jgi:hypothetical protein